MNLLLLAAVLLALLVWLWLIQFAAVYWAGEGRAWTWPLSHGSSSAKVRGAMKAALAIGVLAVLAGYPALIGRDPLHYHLGKMTPDRLGLTARAMLLVFLYLAAMFSVSVLSGWIRLEKRHRGTKLAFRILKGILIPLPLTLMEESLFRGLILEQLIEGLPGAFGAATALIASAALFAAIHFLRPQKHRALAAVGLFYVGVVLGAAYLLDGHNYRLPVAIHAGGVMFIQVTRPISCYLGPPWLIGRSSYPIAGVLGMTAVTLAVAIVGVQIIV